MLAFRRSIKPILIMLILLQPASLISLHINSNNLKDTHFTNVNEKVFAISIHKDLAGIDERWPIGARIVGMPFEEQTEESINRTLDTLKSQYVNTIDYDIDLGNNYDTFIDPSLAVQLTERVVRLAHARGIKVFEYVPGFEMITHNASSTNHTVFKEHPDWVQRDINGRPAIFNSSYAFWIVEDDEDTWVTPLAPEWRAMYMNYVRNITSAGVDAIYIDIPYWMTHFEGWEDSWASFDNYTVAEFTRRTGLQPPENFSMDNEAFLQWIRFRKDVITEFIRDVKSNITAINPDVKLIIENYPSFRDCSRMGADPYEILKYADGIAHEYALYEKYQTSNYTKFDWLNFIAGLKIIQAIDGDKNGWILSYPDTPKDSVILAASDVFMGRSFWELKEPYMSGTVGLDYRTAVFKWISQYSDILYGKWHVIDPVYVYFSPNSRDMLAPFEDHYSVNQGDSDHLLETLGIIIMLLQNHIPFEVVTPRDFTKLTQGILILPNVEAMSNTEIQNIKTFASNGKVIAIANTSLYDEFGHELPDFALAEQFGTSYADTVKEVVNGNWIYHRDFIGIPYMEYIDNGSDSYITHKEDILKLLQLANYTPIVNTNASDFTVITPYTNGTHTLINAINYNGQFYENIQIVRQNVFYELENKTFEFEIDLAKLLVSYNDEIHEIPFIGYDWADIIIPTSGTHPGTNEESKWWDIVIIASGAIIGVIVIVIIKKKYK